MFSYTEIFSLIQVPLHRWIACLVLGLLAQTTVKAQQTLPQVSLRVADTTLNVEVASTPAQHEKGLMQRAHLPEDSGMLFVFDRPQRVCFWMKNTWIPLTAAFLLEDGTVSQLAHMTPLSEEAHCSRIPVRYVLEVNRGWFEAQRLGPGVRFKGGPLTGDR